MHVHTKLLVILLSAMLPTLVIAQKNDPIAIIINHFNQPLDFTVNINPQVLPDLPENFILGINNQTETRVLALNKEAYIRVKAQDLSNKSAFFGLERTGSDIKYHGYISKGIAYSWKKNTIIFCTPEEYQKQKHC